MTSSMASRESRRTRTAASAVCTNTEAAHSRVVDPRARPKDGQGDSLAAPVRLAAKDWSCPWPQEADALGIDRQLVVLRAVVGADGRALSVDLLADPGHGVGEAALGCALRGRFLPARDGAGRAYAATSPPIRVRFTG